MRTFVADIQADPADVTTSQTSRCNLCNREWIRVTSLLPATIAILSDGYFGQRPAALSKALQGGGDAPAAAGDDDAPPLGASLQIASETCRPRMDKPPPT